MTDTKKMTDGSPSRLIFFFAIPLMIGNMFQQIYTITDTLIISRTLGVEALSALGSADWFDYLIISIIQAAAQGCSIRMAQDFGADDTEHLLKTTAHAVVLCFGFSLLMTVFAELMINPMVHLLNTPAEIAWMTRQYLSVKFAGLLLAMLLNFTSSVLRAFGNSRTPLEAMAGAAALNVLLDLLLVRYLDFGIRGAAIATVIAQGSGGLWCLRTIRRIDFLKLKKNHFESDLPLDALLVKLSMPMMTGNLLIAFGGMIVQSRVNTFEMAFIAGYTATNKLYGLLEVAAIAYGFAMVTYIGQNCGAHEYERIRKGYRDSVLIAIGTSLVMAMIMLKWGNVLTSAFLTGNPSIVEEARMHAMHFLRILAGLLPVLYILHVSRSSLQGFGDTTTPMISGIAEFIARIVTALLISRFMGSYAMFWAEIAAWTASDAILFAGLKYWFSKIHDE